MNEGLFVRTGDRQDDGPDDHDDRLEGVGVDDGGKTTWKEASVWRGNLFKMYDVCVCVCVCVPAIV